MLNSALRSLMALWIYQTVPKLEIIDKILRGFLFFGWVNDGWTVPAAFELDGLSGWSLFVVIYKSILHISIQFAFYLYLKFNDSVARHFLILFSFVLLPFGTVCYRRNPAGRSKLSINRLTESIDGFSTEF